MVDNGDHRVSFAVRVTPKSSQNKIIGWEKDENNTPFLRVHITTVPEKGKANKALITLLSKEWKIPKSSLAIEKGETDRHKILSVSQNIFEKIKMY